MSENNDGDTDRVSEYTPRLGERGLYGDFYNLMRALQEDFHRLGTLGDANAKLDEIARLLSVERVASLASRPDLTISLENVKSRSGGKGVAVGLRKLFADARTCAWTLEATETLIAPDEDLAVRDADEATASALVRHFERFLPGGIGGPGHFDVVSEAFSVFVRQNFRQRIDDAQYMTPLEVARPAVRACVDLLAAAPGQRVVIADPTCGVGTFLSAAIDALDEVDSAASLTVVGIDKVPRMTRLARLNLSGSRANQVRIQEANTILSRSWASRLAGKVDLVVTNPPFGAMFDAAEVDEVWGESAAFIHESLAAGHIAPGTTIPSELVLFDIYLSLVRDGGIVGIVVPDGVVAGKGTAARFREHLLSQHSVVASVELPSETFAQAGTRTNTSFLIVRARRASRRTKISFATVKHLGFDVVRRKGVPVKREKGTNEAIEAFRQIGRRRSNGRDGAIGSVTRVPETDLVNGRLRASAYAHANGRPADGTVRLRDIVDLRDRKERGLPSAERPMISVKFVNELGLIDLQKLAEYRPVTPGCVCRPGHVLLSRINPHIPRICVVPDLWPEALCSAEFLILEPKPTSGLTPHGLRTLLMLPGNLKSIQGLAGGTSSSHSRVKDADLMQLQMAMPEGARSALVKKAATTRRDAEKRIYAAIQDVLTIERQLREDVEMEGGASDNGRKKPRGGRKPRTASDQNALPFA